MINKNVYWFLIDGLSPQFLNACGNKQYKKTFIDTCLEKGTVLSKMYCANGGTHTSMHVFFSGFRSSVNGATGWIIEALRSFNPKIFTLTDLFKLNGYNTYRYCDAKGERTVPKSGFDVWMHSGYKIGQLLKNTDNCDCENRSEFINMVNADKGRKFIYHHLELLHDLNCELGTYWSSADYRKNIEIVAKYFEKLYKSYNISDKDIVIISSDHGVLLDTNYTKYESIYGPRQTEQSNICLFSIQGMGIKPQLLDGLSTAIDVAPTLADIFFDMNLPTQGTSIKNYIFGGTYEPKLCFREKGVYFAEPRFPDKSDVYSVRDNNWKYTFSPHFAKSEWLVNLDENEDYVTNLKDEYPELVKKYRKLIYDEIINKKIDIEKFYSAHGFNLSKKDINPEILITPKGSKLTADFMDSVLDLAGPYYKLVLSNAQASKIDKKYLEHPKVIISDDLLTLGGNYVLSVNPKYCYDDEDFLFSFYKNAKKYNCKVVLKSNKSIYIKPKKCLETGKKPKKLILNNPKLVNNPNSLKWFQKERIGNKRVVHIGPIKFTYYKKPEPQSPQFTFDDNNAIYRTEFFNDENVKITNQAKNRDYIGILNSILSNTGNVDMFKDEYIENRYGMKLILDDILTKPKDLVVFDIACGSGSLIKSLANHGYKTVGIDINPYRVLRCRDNGLETHFAFSENIPLPDNSADIIVSQETLEHVCDIELTLQEMNRLLKPGGEIYIQVPYADLVDCPNHVRLFDENSLKKILGKYFKITSCEIIPYLTTENPNNIFIKAKSIKK